MKTFRREDEMNNPPPKKRDRTRAIPFRIALIYVIVGALLILILDQLFGLIVREKETLTSVSILVDWIFIAATGTILYFIIKRNLVEIRQSQKSLKESEKRFKALFNQASDAIFLMDPFPETGPILMDVNDVSCKMYGYSKRELIGKPITFLDDPESATHVPERKRRLLAGESLTFETTHIRKDKSSFPVEVSAQILELGGNSYIQAIHRDITERKKKIDQLRQSEEKYRTLFETMAQGVVYQDSNGKITSANPAAEKILGLTLDQMQGRTSTDPSWRSIKEDGSEFPGEEHPAMVALKTGKIVKNTLMGVFHPKEDRYHWIMINAVPQFKENQSKPYQVYTTFTDVTERRLTREALEDERNYVSAILETVGALIIVLDTEGRIVSFNRACEVTTGFSFDEVKGEELWDILILPEEKSEVRSVFYDLREGVFPLRHESYLITKSRGKHFISWADSAIVNEEGKVETIIKTGIDITDRKRAEQALEQKDIEIRKAYSDVLNAFTGGRLFIMTAKEIHESLGTPVSEKFEIDSYEELSDARTKISEMLEKNFPAVDRDKIIIATNEALTNAIKHGSKGDYQIFRQDGSVQIFISDVGPGIDFKTLPKATLLSGFSTKQTLGVGFDLILDLCDRVLLSTQQGNTNVVLEIRESADREG